MACASAAIKIIVRQISISVYWQRVFTSLKHKLYISVAESLEVPLAIDHSVERKISIWKHQAVKNKWSASTDKTQSEATK